MPAAETELITEDWLRSIGFRWQQFHRQPSKQWVLWIGRAALVNNWADDEDLGVELAHNRDDDWFCWVRSDSSHRYHRFLHIRHLKYRADVVRLLEGLVGRPFEISEVWYGSWKTPEVAARLIAERERLDKRIHSQQKPWLAHEADEDRGRPSMMHVDAAIKGGLAK